MNIDEAIVHAREVAEGCPAEDRQCAYQHDKLADWLEELKGYRASGLTPEEIDELLHKSYGPLHKKLGQWIASERDGRLVMLPCKVGDIVYDILDGTPYATRVLSFAYFGDHWACRTVSSYPDLEEFGKRIFLTQAEAEAALAAQKE